MKLNLQRDTNTTIKDHGKVISSSIVIALSKLSVTRLLEVKYSIDKKISNKIKVLTF